MTENPEDVVVDELDRLDDDELRSAHARVRVARGDRDVDDGQLRGDAVGEARDDLRREVAGFPRDPLTDRPHGGSADEDLRRGCR
ncbi:MAG: hypothetical protein LBE07_00580, partial [Gordonia sp. (in: high G+C Gram-positive bacteria)]|nr:hypothetical protein [Gordonia sp. (in: high G+C Gram-positive bacteria)]